MDDERTAADEVTPLRFLPDVARSLFTRRRFLTVVGGTGVGGYLWHPDFVDASIASQYADAVRRRFRRVLKGAAETVKASPAVSTTKPTRTLTTYLRRREDMLRLRLEFFNLIPGNNPNQLVKKNANQPAFVVVNFPPQHLAEQALLRTAAQRRPEDGTKPGDGPDEYFGSGGLARARLAGESRLVFEVPNTALPMARTQQDFLSWIRWNPRLAPGARLATETSGPALAAPGATTADQAGETALEVPWRLVLSPLPGAAWAHLTTLPNPTNAGAYEMWNTRLGVRKLLQTETQKLVYASENGDRFVRAIWSTDPAFPPNVNPMPSSDVIDDDDNPKTKKPNTTVGDGDGDFALFEPFRTSLSPRNRVSIVRNSAGFNYAGKVKPIDVNRLMLSPLGATLDVVGKWDDPTSQDLLLWKHRAALGRDNYVEIIERGYFLPWGFPALRIKVTERAVENRDFTAAPGGKLNTAFLRQRIHYVILDPTVDFPTVADKTAAHDMPFRQVRAVTLVTPDVADDAQLFSPTLVPSLGPASELNSSAGSPNGAFRFDLEATDWEGRTITFRQPMAFAYTSLIGQGASGSPPQALSIRNKWNALPATHVLKRTPLNGQTVAFAPSAVPGDTSFETSYLTTNLNPPNRAIAKDQAVFYPVMDQADVRVEAAETFSGTGLGGSVVAYPQHYKANGFSGNAPYTFLGIVQPNEVKFASSEAAGGLATPSLSITALSRSLGAIGGTLESQLANAFDPDEWFAGLDARLAGLNLVEIIDSSGTLEKSMSLKTTKTDEGRIATLNWKPTLKPDPLEILKPTRGSKKGSFELDAKIVRRNDGTVTSDVRGELLDVTLQLLGGGALHFLDVEIRRLIFTSRTGTSPHLDVRLGEITFAGPLTFVNELRSILANPKGPVGIEVNGQGILARASVSVPSLGVGIFSLKNLALHAKIGVPFTNEPTYAEFGISSKKDPFQVAVSVFGGGGWFALAVNTNGLQSIEAGFEFGGTVSVDFGVAGGSIEIMAGIYFRVEELPEGQRVELTGFVRFHGEVHVAFVSVGLSAELDLSYVTKPSGKSVVTGRCSVTLEVPAAPDVSFEIEKSFGGDPHDPRYVDQITPTEWLAYVDAFTDEA